MMPFDDEGTRGNKRNRGDSDDRGAEATDCMELEAHGYEVEPREVVDENGYVIMEQPHSTYAPR